MDTRYFVYEIDGASATVLVATFLALVAAAVLVFFGPVAAETAFTVYIAIDLIGSAYLSGRKEVASEVETYG